MRLRVFKKWGEAGVGDGLGKVLVGKYWTREGGSKSLTVVEDVFGLTTLVETSNTLKIAI